MNCILNFPLRSCAAEGNYGFRHIVIVYLELNGNMVVKQTTAGYAACGLSQCPYSAHTMPKQCPYSAHCKNTQCPYICLLRKGRWSCRIFLEYIRIWGLCVFTMGTVWALYGHCMGTVWALFGPCVCTVLASCCIQGGSCGKEVKPGKAGERASG